MERLEKREALSSVGFGVELYAMDGELIERQDNAPYYEYVLEPGQQFEVRVTTQTDGSLASVFADLQSTGVEVDWDLASLKVSDRLSLDFPPVADAVTDGYLATVNEIGGYIDIFGLPTNEQPTSDPQFFFSIIGTVSEDAAHGTQGWIGTDAADDVGHDLIVRHEGYAEGVYGSVFFTVFDNEWHNRDNPFDVNGDGSVTPADEFALDAFQWDVGGGMLPKVEVAPAFVDVNNNLMADPLDLVATSMAVRQVKYQAAGDEVMVAKYQQAIDLCLEAGQYWVDEHPGDILDLDLIADVVSGFVR